VGTALHMKVVLINETHSPLMGYMGTVLPKYLARLGMDVHLIATELPAYHNFVEHKAAAPKFLKEQSWPAGTVRVVDGYTVHILQHGRMLRHVYMKGLRGKLMDLKPDVVYSILALGWIPLQAAAIKILAGYQFFSGSHTTALSFPLTPSSPLYLLSLLKAYLTRWVPGRIVSLFSKACYCPTRDCGEVAHRFFGVQRQKIKIVHLGVDGEFFFPVRNSGDRDRREQIRRQLGFHESDVVFMYTGKIALLKNPVLLAQAIERLSAEGHKCKGVFIGDGNQRAAVSAYQNCVVLEYMPFGKLGDYYRAADAAVWPTNESTSMLDAAACGLPIIVSDRIYQDHVSGNGIAYRMNDLNSLCDAMRSLQDPALRNQLGQAGANKMRSQFAWEIAAKIRFDDFTKAVG
jgi:glycosyltransferase involved in cell wall biosynthesis